MRFKLSFPTSEFLKIAQNRSFFPSKKQQQIKKYSNVGKNMELIYLISIFVALLLVLLTLLYIKGKDSKKGK